MCNAFLKLYHINKSRLNALSCKKPVQNVQRSLSSDSTEAVSWLEDYASYYGDRKVQVGKDQEKAQSAKDSHSGDRMSHNTAILLPYKTQNSFFIQPTKERGVSMLPPLQHFTSFGSSACHI